MLGQTLRLLKAFFAFNHIIYEQNTGDQLILLRFKNTLPGTWLIHLENTSNTSSDPNVTVTSPGNARSVLTVTAYNQFNSNIPEESGRGYSGTGAATAHTAGIMAMVFEWAIVKGNYSQMTGNIINRQLIWNATRDHDNTYPNNIWGYGQVEINNFFKVLNSA
jgi:hypothetical protein